MTKQELKELLEENLSLELCTEGCNCGCGDTPRLVIKIVFDDEVICSNHIYLSSLRD